MSDKPLTTSEESAVPTEIPTIYVLTDLAGVNHYHTHKLSCEQEKEVLGGEITVHTVPPVSDWPMGFAKFAQ
jgi:hypothetical protein